MDLRLTPLACLACFFLTGAFGQTDGTADSINAFKRTFPEKLTLRTSLNNTGNSFYFRDRETGDRLLLNPGAKNYLGFSLLFRSVELDLGFAPGFLNTPRADADPSLFNLNMRMYTGHWMQTLDFYLEDGFYFDLNGSTGYLPNLNTLKVGGVTSYIFNPRFSFRAISFQNEWQRKSAGSFVPSLLAYYTRYRVSDGDVREISHTYNLAAGPGYYYNWVFRDHFLFSLGNNAGLGLGILNDQGRVSTSLLFQSIFRAALGYNSERFFAGVNASYTYLHHGNFDGEQLDDRTHFFEVYLGYRVKAPVKWVQAADRINRKFGWD